MNEEPDILLTQAVMDALDAVSGIDGASYWFDRETKHYFTSYEHLFNLSAELGLDYEAIKNGLTELYAQTLVTGEIARWDDFVLELIVDDSFFQRALDAAETAPTALSLYLNLFLTIITPDYGFKGSQAAEKYWLKVKEHATTQGVTFTEQEATIWDERVLRLMLPHWLLTAPIPEPTPDPEPTE